MSSAREPETLQNLTREHLLAAARAWQPTVRVSNFNSKTPREVVIDGQCYPTKAIVALAHELAGFGALTSAELAGRAARRCLEALGFTLVPEEREVASWSEAGLRSAAAVLARNAGGPGAEIGMGAEDPVQVVIDDVEYPVGAVLGLPEPPRSVLPSEAVKAIREAGFALRVARDALDDELDALANSDNLSTEAKREVTARIGQGRFRAALLALHGRCALTGVSEPSVLRASHIHRWADCKDELLARRDPENGLLLTANLDCLFEGGLIAFDDQGEILISPKLDTETQARLGLHANMRLALTPSAAQQAYLAKHRHRTRAMRPGEAA